MEAPGQAIRRWGNEVSIARTRTADPVLRRPELAWLLVRATSSLQKNTVDLADEAEGEWEARLQSVESIVHGPDVVRDLTHVVDGHAGRFGVLEQEEVGERRLRALDLGGK